MLTQENHFDFLMCFGQTGRRGWLLTDSFCLTKQTFYVKIVCSTGSYSYLVVFPIWKESNLQVGGFDIVRSAQKIRIWNASSWNDYISVVLELCNRKMWNNDTSPVLWCVSTAWLRDRDLYQDRFKWVQYPFA